jgi:hypothetical protein
VTVDVHLTLARPRADVALRGDLGAEAAALLMEAVDTARIVGCRRITLHLDGAGSADENFIEALRQLRHSCTGADEFFEVNGFGIVPETPKHAPMDESAARALTGEETR